MTYRVTMLHSGQSVPINVTAPAMARAEYRPDVDGLRAIAVSGVVAFHMGLPGARGGFVGVDVFFVISGYLITQILMAELTRTGRIDLWDFYARRVRRLLPAFILVALTTLALGAVILLPIQSEQSRLASSAIHAAGYISNIEFARMGGYFDPASELQPLLHTWSLAIEAQFCLIWPLLLIGVSRLGRRMGIPLSTLAAIVLSGVIAASFVYAVWAARVDPHVAKAGFFMISTRAWELAAGAALAIMLLRVRRGQGSRRIAEAIGFAGLAAIAAAILLIDPAQPYPGVAAAVPVLGATAVIAAGHLHRTVITQLLSLRPFVLVGLVSYGWYLWHWPLLALARSQAMGAPDLLRDGALVVLALVLAWLTYHHVEKPIRNAWKPVGGRRFALALATAGNGMIVVAALALIGWGAELSKSDARLARFINAAQDTNPLRTPCNQSNATVGLPPADGCLTPAASRLPRIVVWGDSHADHIVPMIAEAGRTQGWATLQRSMSACPPTRGATPMRGGRPRANCANFNEMVLDELRRMDPRMLRGVVLAARWTIYQDRKAIAVRDAGAAMRLQVDHDREHLDPTAAIAASLASTLDALKELGVPVVIIAPVPELEYAAPLCLARRHAEACGYPRAENEHYRADALSILERLAATHTDVRVFDPIDALCGPSNCAAEQNGTILFSDDDHITATAARGLARHFIGIGAWLVAADRGRTAPSQL